MKPHDPHPQQPSAFVGGGLPYHPQPVGPSYTQDVRAGYALPAVKGRLSAQADGTVSIDAKSARLLPAGDNTIDLRIPVREGDCWHLDCRPGGLCSRRPNGASGGVRFRAKERVRLLLGVMPGPIVFEFESVGNGLFRLYPLGGDK